MTSGEFDALRIERCYPYGDMLAEAFESQLEPSAQFEQLSIVVERVASEQQVDDLHGFLQSRQRRIEFHAVEMFDDLRAAGSKADNRSAIREFIERPEMLRERGRRARINVDDRGGELNPAGLLRDGREQRERIVSPRFATQIEWIPTASAIFARSITPLRSKFSGQFRDIASLRVMFRVLHDLAR